MSVITNPFVGSFEADRHSSVVFGIRHMQIATFRGSFGDVEARLEGDESGVRLEGSAQIESISIGEPPEFREHVVQSADFFDAGTHPVIRFRSEHVDLRPDGTLTVEGDLTIRDVTRSLQATGTYAQPVEDPFGSERVALELFATIDRRDWGITWQTPLPNGLDALGWDVDVTIQLELVKQADRC
jgi:polyisoprenoid-binding protein YceI